MLCILYDAPHMCLCKIIMYYTLQDGGAFYLCHGTSSMQLVTETSSNTDDLNCYNKFLCQAMVTIILFIYSDYK